MKSYNFGWRVLYVDALKTVENISIVTAELWAHMMNIKVPHLIIQYIKRLKNDSVTDVFCVSAIVTRDKCTWPRSFQRLRPIYLVAILISMCSIVKQTRVWLPANRTGFVKLVMR